jgi:hypothetical protein
VVVICGVVSDAFWPAANISGPQHNNRTRKKQNTSLKRFIALYFFAHSIYIDYKTALGLSYFRPFFLQIGVLVLIA